MKIALCVPKLTENSPQNFETIKDFIHKCGKTGVDFVQFPEACISGLNLVDDPYEDLKLGIEIPQHPYIHDIKLLAKSYNMNISIGILEREDTYLYDSAIFINRSGEIINKYRRVHVGWRDKNITEVYREGTIVSTFNCDLGRCLFLICGDAFYPPNQELVRNLNPDFVLLPLARNFSPISFDHNRWINEAEDEYLNMVKELKSTTLMVNYIDNCCFGGAFIISNDGKILSERKLNEEGILFYEI